jgi:uncharacterized LabA/DUF88 family protein
MQLYKQETIENYAFIDGQNLQLGTLGSHQAWVVSFKKFRIYLREKYQVLQAYYFLGFIQEKYRDMYIKIQEAGFILVFREHHSLMQGKKKGNVDCDIVFSIMQKLYKKEIIGKVILVSGDGDYKRLVDFLIEENKLKKILFPDAKKASSLYRDNFDSKYTSDLSNKDIKKKIEKMKRVP